MNSLFKVDITKTKTCEVNYKGNFYFKGVCAYHILYYVSVSYSMGLLNY